MPTQEFTPPPAGTDERDSLDDALVDEAAPAEEEPSEVYDFATDEEPFGGAPEAPAGPVEDSDDFEALGPVTDEQPVEAPAREIAPEEEEEPDFTDEHVVVRDPDDETGDFDPSTMVRHPDDSDEFEAPAVDDEADGGEEDSGDEGAGEEDILAGSPDFVEDGEDEDLWFEKGPPKDFDFEDEK